MAKNKARITRLEKTKANGAAHIRARSVIEVGGRYFETCKSGDPFRYEAVIQAITWTPEDFAAAGFPELTRAEFDELTMHSLNNYIQFDHVKLLPSGTFAPSGNGSHAFTPEHIRDKLTL